MQLTQDITNWTITSDGFGGYTYETPTLLKGLWLDKHEMFRNASNEEVVSNAIVYLDSDVEVGSYIAQGDYTSVADPTTLSGASRVLGFRKIPNITSIRFERKAFL